MSTHQIHVFISHSWKYSGHYNTLSGWVFQSNWRSGQASLKFHNYSVPLDDPIHDAPSDAKLKEAINNQIARSHVIVIPTGMYVNYSKWIIKEIEASLLKSKPILAVNPWGQERKSIEVTSAANKIVGWNSASVVSGIWDLYYK
jgi:hypothetical protein